MRKRNPGFAAILVLVLLVLIAAGAYYLGTQKGLTIFPFLQTYSTPASDPTAIWKTYTNETFGIAFDYPPDFRVEEDRVPTIYINPQQYSIFDNPMGSSEPASWISIESSAFPGYWTEERAKKLENHQQFPA